MGHGAYIFGCETTRLTAEEKRFFAGAQPWGFILFTRNVNTPGQVHALCTELRQAVGWNAPIMIDQEGGRVARMAAPHWREWLSPIEQVRATGSNAARSMRLRYRLIGHELCQVGIDCNCAPVADIATPATHPVLANRCYGSRPDQVAEIARAVADGLGDTGVLPVLKHMPGQGRADLDSHTELPVVSASLPILQTSDFAAFAALSDLPMAMTSHIVYSAIDGLPATFSPPVIDMMRKDIGFQGLLMTDDISMQALSGTVGERAPRALAAGCDLVLHCNGNLGEMQTIADACGEIGAVSAERAKRALAKRPMSGDFDIAATRAELADLLAGTAHV
ncbi:MAG: glycoside hydrolase family 3 N-terminal domain-containing protein [Paracoccaceae bacterium]